MTRYKQLHKKLLLLPAALLMLAGSSCRKDLNYTPEVFLSAQQVYKDQAGATAGVTGIYQQLQSIKKNEVSLMGIIGTDEMRFEYQAQAWGGYWAKVAGLDSYDITFNSQNDVMGYYWNYCYVGIANANYAIQYIPQIRNFADVTVQNRLLAEAKFLRALFYFQLVQFWGDVPLRMEDMPFGDGVPRAPQDKIYELIISDLQYAQQNLWVRSKTPDAGRATVETAEALLGKVYLTLHRYSDAKPLFEDLINNKGIVLNADYADLFNKENTPESLLEVQYSPQSGATNGLQNIFGASLASTPGGPTGNTTPGYGGNVVITTAWYADSLFDKVNDKRYAASITPHFYASSDPSSNYDWWVDIGLPHLKKYDITTSSGSIDINNSAKNVIYLRSADVFLMYAEVLNELGQSNAALAPLNKVRDRAFGDALHEVPPTAQAALRDTIMDERSRELGGEGWRWFDLKRTNTLVQRVLTHDNPRPYYVARNGEGDPHLPQNVSDMNYLYPIPLSELQNNPALSLTSQNPGY